MRERRAVPTILTRAVASTEVPPYSATADRAPIYPPAFARVLPTIEHPTGTMVQQRIERDYQHLKGRYRSMRGFQTALSAQVICAEHGFMRNLPDGCYRLGLPSGNPSVQPAPRRMQAWDEITQILIAR